MRAGFCAIVGLPNVGKSTLLNRILGQRLVAVSSKPQTTRNRIVGIHNVEGAQIAFVDTPGIQAGKGALRKYMREVALSAAGETDAALLIIDAADPRGRLPGRLDEPDAAPMAQAIANRPLVVALNKIDRVAKPELLPLIAAWDAWASTRTSSAAAGGVATSGATPGAVPGGASRSDTIDIVPIAALTGDGVGRLVDAIVRRLPEGEAMFPDDVVTDRADRFLAAELIREQLFHQLGKELPYAAAVLIETFEERAEKKDVVIGAVIVVERESQKAIVVGKGGQRIKQLGIAAREAVAEMLDCPVHLTLHVKVIPDWSQGERGMRQVGLDPKQP